MNVILSGIKIPAGGEENLFETCRKKAKLSKTEAVYFKILKKSVDARDKSEILFVYTVEIGDKPSKNEFPEFPSPLKKPAFRPAVIGSGPAGLFAALILTKGGLCPVIFERGSEVSKRKEAVKRFWGKGELDINCNVQFGEGGAGTFSDGKLNTQTKGAYIPFILETYVKYGAPQEILFNNKPHIGTDILSTVVENMRKDIISLGGEFRFDTLVKDIHTENGYLKGIFADRYYAAEKAVLATGHSSRDTFAMLYNKGVRMSQKAFSAGVRIEHLRHMIDVSQYGKFAGNNELGAADYKLFHHLDNGRTIYTFCMCPGGYVVAAASEKDMVATNGMSLHKRDGINSNSALLVSVLPEDFPDGHPLSGLEFQRELERKAFLCGGGNYRAPACTADDFLNNKVSAGFGEILPTYRPGVNKCSMHDVLPGFIAQGIKEGIKAFDKKLRGFACGDAVLTGVESRSSSPVKIERDETCESVSLKGLYPCGEGAGFAGGIVSAAADGIKTAVNLINGIK